MKRTLAVVLPTLLLGCADGAEASGSSSLQGESSYDGRFVGLVEEFDLRESDVPVRNLPGWVPPQRVVVVVPEEWDIREERMAFLQEVAPGVELIPVKRRPSPYCRRPIVTSVRTVPQMSSRLPTPSLSSKKFTSGSPPEMAAAIEKVEYFVI